MWGERMMLMSEIKLCCLPGNAATEYAARYLKDAGITVTEETQPDTTHLLLPVPTRSFDELPEGVTIIGGNLHCLPGFRTIDLLKDPWYLAENAAITARCAMGLIGKDLMCLPVLILGWGRIGKCLGKFLGDAGAKVTIAVRKEEDAALIRALGYGSILTQQAAGRLWEFDAVLNTVPAMVLPAVRCRPDCVLLELASRPGMAGGNIIRASGLPGKYAPEESGRLIARRLLAILKEGTA